MSVAVKFLRRDPAQIAPWAETCGQIRCLVEEKDGAAAEVQQVEIRDARLHYHERTDEFYYIIDSLSSCAVRTTSIQVALLSSRQPWPSRRKQSLREGPVFFRDHSSMISADFFSARPLTLPSYCFVRF